MYFGSQEFRQNTTSSKMEQGKSRYNSLLAFAVLVNFLLTLTTIGFVFYKTRGLEQQVFQLQTKSSLTSQTETRENRDEDLAHRKKRSSESHKEPKNCVSCHNACVKLFGLGASAKVRGVHVQLS